MSISIEFLILILLALIAFLLIIYACIERIKKILKDNETLEKTSTEYIKNRKKIFSKLIIIIIIIYIIEILFCVWNYNSACMCGFLEFKMLPLLIFMILQFISICYIFILSKKKEYTIDYLVKFIFMTFILFILVAVLSKNDVDALHNNRMVGPIIMQ